MTDFTDISLTSIPPRFSRLGETLESLLHQTVEIKNIWLTIPKSYKRFPNWNGVLPKVPKGIKINRINEDLGPASIIIPILKKPTLKTTFYIVTMTGSTSLLGQKALSHILEKKHLLLLQVPLV